MILGFWNVGFQPLQVGLRLKLGGTPCKRHMWMENFFSIFETEQFLKSSIEIANISAEWENLYMLLFARVAPAASLCHRV